MGDIPDEYYQGSYLADLAEELQKRDGNRWLDLTAEEWLLIFWSLPSKV